MAAAARPGRLHRDERHAALLAVAEAHRDRRAQPVKRRTAVVDRLALDRGLVGVRGALPSRCRASGSMWVCTSRSSGTASRIAALEPLDRVVRLARATGRAGASRAERARSRPSTSITRTLWTSRTSGTVERGRGGALAHVALGVRAAPRAPPRRRRRAPARTALLDLVGHRRGPALTPASSGTATTRSTKWCPPRGARAARRSSTCCVEAGERGADALVGVGVAPIHQHVDRLAWRAAAAARTTSTATNSAATASAQSSPAATRIRPTSTASEPARSDAQWSALAASAGEW